MVGRESPLMGVCSGSESASSEGEVTIGMRRAWHRSQYALPTEFIVPHIGQRSPVRIGSDSPHSLQKRLPRRLAAPHLGQ
jgi:hypothetical protein